MSKSVSVGTVLTVNSKTVGGLKTINGIEINADKVDVTSLDNSTGYKEYLAGFKDVSDLSVTGVLDGSDEGQTECYTLLNSGQAKTCTIVFPTAIGKTWTFTASVIKFTTSVDVNDAITFEAAFAVTGQPVLAATVSG